MHAAPPLKRQRVSTPHRTSSSSTSHPQSPVDVQRERDASKLRLLDIWSSLAERYTRRLDEDDIVDIRTGKITTDRGFIRNSRKINFGAIAAPAAEDMTADEGTDEEEEDEYDTDELDAFADTTSDVDNVERSEMPPASGSADAEDLRAFLEAERRRKDLCGSEVEDSDYSAASDSADVEDLRAFLEAERRRKDLCGSEDEEDDYSTPDQGHYESDLPDPSLLNNAADTSESYPEQTGLDLASEDELDNWDVDESSVVYPVLKLEDNDSDIEIIEGPTLSKATPKLITNKSRDQLQTPPLLNKSTSTSNVRTPSIKPYVLLTPRKSTGLEKSKRKNRQHLPPPEIFVPPIPDPRAQFIITQAMQQLSALVGTPWAPPHDSPFIPYTPTRRHQFRQVNSTFNTPTYHPHPYPYSYNPDLSLATLPPESPQSVSSPEKSSHGPRKSSMVRSRSRGRRVSFKLDDDESGDDDRGRGRVDIYSSPSKPPLKREAVREQGRPNFSKPSKGKGKAGSEAPDSESSSEDPLNCGSDRDRKSHLRRRTPGPKIGPPKGIKRRQDLKGRLKDVA